MCCSPWGRKESDTTEWLTLSLSTYILIVWFCFHSESLIQKEREASHEKSWCRNYNHRQEWATKSEECNFFWEKRNWNRYFVVVVVQLLSPVWLSATPPTAAQQASLSSTISWSLLKFMSFESVLLPIYFILCLPLLLLPSIFPSICGSNLIPCKYWSCLVDLYTWTYIFRITYMNKQ